MSKIRFDNLIPLPALGDVQLAATGVRALENFSDLVQRHTRPVPLKQAERLDITEDFLDLVTIRHDLPAGFEFTGITVAQFRAALLSERHRPSASPWLNALASSAMVELHQAARRRIAIRPKTACIQHLMQWLPLRYTDQPYVPVPDSIQRLMVTAGIGWKPPKRSRFLVELVSEAGSPTMLVTMRGKHFQVAGETDWPWRSWDLYRLQPRTERVDFNCRPAGYREYQLALPSVEGSYFSPHFPARNIFAHFRSEFFTDTDGRRVLLLHEIQSDWLRDLRLQRRQKPRTTRRYYVGQSSKERKWELVPDCPVGDAWLDLAIEAVVDIARQHWCQAIAWLPGTIMGELNPGMPISANRLYDLDVPRALSRLLNKHGSETLQVAFPTYKRNVMMAYQRGKGHFLTGPDGKTPMSEAVPDEETLLSLFRAQAIHAVEILPAYDLSHAPRRYAQPDHVVPPLEQPKFENEENLCG